MLKTIAVLFVCLLAVQAFKINARAKLVVELRDDPIHKCLESKCPKEWAACKNDPKCVPLLHNCLKKCNQSESCWRQCLVSGHDNNAVAVMQCGAKNHCFDQQAILSIEDSTHDCSMKKCPNEWKKCSDDPKCAKIIHGCANDCKDDSSCWRKCLAKGQDSNAVNLMRCGEVNHCYDKDFDALTLWAEDDFHKCIHEKCSSIWDDCNADSKCVPTLHNCYAKCNQSESCWKLCLAASGDKNAESVMKCTIANKCFNNSDIAVALVNDPTHDCSIKKCPNEWKKCSDDPKCAKIIHGCASECDQDSSCWRKCLAKGQDSNAVNLMRCGEVNHCYDKEETSVSLVSDSTHDCSIKKCPNEWKKCSDDPKCAKIIHGCANDCKDDSSCWRTCLTKAGDANATNLVRCGVVNHCYDKEETAVALTNDIHDCSVNKCPNEWKKCKEDPKCAKIIHGCVNDCDEDSSCWRKCLTKGGDANAVNLMRCGEANHCYDKEIDIEAASTSLTTVDPEQCIKEKCPGQYDKCTKDPKCKPTLDKCKAKCNTDQNCWKFCLVKEGDKPAEDVAKCAAANHCL